VQAEPAFQKGWFEVQDEGSQIAAALVGAEAGMQLLDYCAGAGGKTLALSADMGNRGQIFAFDSEKQRLAPIFDRLRRADSRNVQVLSKPAELSALEGHMDVVLVDAPCTGSGTWRRRPDAKWRLTHRQLDGRRAEQIAILDAASLYVKPGGLLAYVTCSVFREENHEQVEAFLGRNGGFVAADHGALWRRRFPSVEHASQIEKLGVTLTPATSGTDGFFFSALRRAT
jgi:16S rRNA (cytosine967-C5)-methyltransferase